MELFHTTSLRAAESILESHQLVPNASAVIKHENEAFVSFSERPVYSDISGNDVTLVFNGQAFGDQIMRVDYDDDWFNANHSHGSYIAGQGWSEQYQPPDELYEPPEDADEFWEPEQDVLEEDYRNAEMDSFFNKSNEKEWISKQPNQPVSFAPAALVKVIVQNPQYVSSVRAFVQRLGYKATVLSGNL